MAGRLAASADAVGSQVEPAQRLRIERDDDTIKVLEDEVQKFLAELDEKVKALKEMTL